jgi:site-specific DNA-methyltransferase (adenine-specific)
MKPYYQDDAVTIYHGDCRDILPTLEPVDLVLTSPPYNLSEGGRRVSGTHWNDLVDGYPSHSDDMNREDYVLWQREVLSLCWAVLSVNGAIFYNHKPIPRDGEMVLPFDLNPGLPLRQIITWDRTGGIARCYWYYVPTYEWIMVFAKPEFRITTLDVNDLWRFPPEKHSTHPAPFPIALPKKAIASTAAAIILDPFMGSGTTLRAAKDLGRKAIGIEIEERYCEIAAKRMAQSVMAL